MCLRMVLIVLQVIFLGRCLVYPQNVVPLQCEHSIAHAPGMAARWRCRAMVFAYVLRWGPINCRGAVCCQYCAGAQAPYV